MKVRAALAASILALGLAGTATPAHAATEAVSPQDAAFLAAAHQGNLTEIASGYVALARSGDADVRHLAWELVVDHWRLDAKVRAVARHHHVRLPRRPDQQQLDDLAKVARTPRADFTDAWLAMQQAGHTATLAAVEQEISTGTDSDVTDLAKGAKPVVTEHLQMVHDLLS
jgi:putative membrane protein